MGSKPHCCSLYVILPSALEDDGTKCTSTGINIIVELKLPFGFHSLSHEELILMLILKELAPRSHLDKAFPDFAAENYTFLFFVFEVSHY